MNEFISNNLHQQTHQKLNIIIVEDEKILGQSLADFLSGLNHQVKWFQDFENVKTFINEQSHWAQAYLIDLHLGNQFGLDLIPIIRQKNAAYIIVFSATNEPDIKYQCFTQGANDFMTKPFDLRELLYRLQKYSLQQEQQLIPHHTLELDGFIINFDLLEIRLTENASEQLKNFPPKLTTKEIQILQFFCHRLNSIISRDEIINEIYGQDSLPNLRTIDNNIVNIRKTLNLANNNEYELVSKRNMGYGLIKKR